MFCSFSLLYCPPHPLIFLPFLLVQRAARPDSRARPHVRATCGPERACWRRFYLPISRLLSLFISYSLDIYLASNLYKNTTFYRFLYLFSFFSSSTYVFFYFMRLVRTFRSLRNYMSAHLLRSLHVYAKVTRRHITTLTHASRQFY